MSEKVKVTKAVAKAIEYALVGRDKAELLKAHAVEGDWLLECAPLNDMDMVTLAQALIIGYEVEKTSEEKLREFYQVVESELSVAKERRWTNAIISCESIRVGVKRTLEILDIEIEGINKEETK